MYSSHIVFRHSRDLFFQANKNGIELNYKEKKIVSRIKPINDPFRDRIFVFVYLNPLSLCMTKWGKRFQLTYPKNEELVNSQISRSLMLFLGIFQELTSTEGTFELFQKYSSLQAKIAIILNKTFERNEEYYEKLANGYNKYEMTGVNATMAMAKFDEFIERNNLPKQVDLQFFRYLNRGNHLDKEITQYWNYIFTREGITGSHQHFLLLKVIRDLKSKMQLTIREKIPESFFDFLKNKHFIEDWKRLLNNIWEKYEKNETVKMLKEMIIEATYYNFQYKLLSPIWQKEIIRNAIEEIIQVIEFNYDFYVESIEKIYEEKTDLLNAHRKNREYEKALECLHFIKLFPDTSVGRKAKLDDFIGYLKKSINSARTLREQLVLEYWKLQHGVSFQEELLSVLENDDYIAVCTRMLQLLKPVPLANICAVASQNIGVSSH